MTNASLVFAITSTIVIAGIAGLVLFITSLAKKNPVLGNWGLGFFLITWVRIPTLFAISGNPLGDTVSDMMPMFMVVGMAMIAGQAFILRGTLLQNNLGKVWTNTFPLLVFIFISVLVGSLSAAEIRPMGSIIVTSLFVLANIAFLIYSNAKKLTGVLSKVQRTGYWLSIIGWSGFFAAHSYFTYLLNKHSMDLWFFALSSTPTIYIYFGFAMSYVLILFGIMLSQASQSNNLETGENG